MVRLASSVLVAVVVVSCAPRLSRAAGIHWEEGTLAASFLRADREHKLVFVDLYATWCTPCQQMDADVFPREDVARVVSANYIALRKNGEAGDGLEIAKSYHVAGFPTLLVLDAHGVELDRMMGSISSAALVVALDRLHDGKGTMADLERELAEAPTDALRLEVATRHALRVDAHAVAELEDVVRADPDNRHGRAANALLVLGKYYYLRGMGDYVHADQTLAALERRFPSSDEARQAPYHRASALQRGGRPAEARVVLDNWIQKSPKEEGRLAAYAWFCFKESNDWRRGIEIAKRGLELAPRDDGLWDTLGELYSANAQRNEALHAFDKAAELAPKNEYHQLQLRKLKGQ